MYKRLQSTACASINEPTTQDTTAHLNPRVRFCACSWASTLFVSVSNFLFILTRRFCRMRFLFLHTNIDCHYVVCSIFLIHVSIYPRCNCVCECKMNTNVRVEWAALFIDHWSLFIDYKRDSNDTPFLLKPHVARTGVRGSLPTSMDGRGAWPWVWTERERLSLLVFEWLGEITHSILSTPTWSNPSLKIKWNYYLPKTLWEKRKIWMMDTLS